MLNYPHMLEYDVCYLWHDDTDVVDALYDRLAVTGDCHRPLRAVWQHLTGDLDTRSSYLKKVKKYKNVLFKSSQFRHLSHFLDLAAPLAYKWSALAGGNHEAESDGGPGNSAGADQIV